jgi:integrase
MPISSEQLWLFDCGGVDLSALRERSEALQRFTRSRKTISDYSSDWRQFERWCLTAGQRPMPADPSAVQLYITWMLDQRQRKITTAERHVSAISYFHRAAGLKSPTSPALRDTIRGVRRERREQPIGKTALDPRDLARVALKLDARTALGARDRALVVIGFATGFRRNELARLQMSDLSFEKKGLAVLLRFSKRDQTGKGRLFAVWKGKRASTDPVRVLRAWLRHRGGWDGPLFCRIQSHGTITKKGISGEAVNEAVKRAIANVGIDSTDYGAHSLRSGAITASAQLGRSDQELIGLSGHENIKSLKSYVRRARLFEGRNPLAGVL